MDDINVIKQTGLYDNERQLHLSAFTTLNISQN